MKVRYSTPFAHLALICLSFLLLVSTGCKEEEYGKIFVQLKTTSEIPAEYDEINIDIKRIESKYANANKNNEFDRYYLNAHEGIWNLTILADGEEHEIARKTTLPAGDLVLFKIVAGSNNSIVVNGNEFPLSIDNSDTSGVSMVIDERIYAGQESTLVLDIDLGSSIVLENGAYIFRPVMEIAG